MVNNQDRNQKLEFLRLLLHKSEANASALNSALRQFFAFSLVFFILSRFYTSEMNLFGVKLEIPQAWITSIAPLVLSFYYLRIVSLYDTLSEYDGEIIDLAPEAISGDQWKIDSKHAFRIRESLFWFKELQLIDIRKGQVSYWMINFILTVLTALTIFFLPLPIIGYFIWLIWKSQMTVISIIVTCLSITLVVFSLILLSRVARDELTT